MNRFNHAYLLFSLILSFPSAFLFFIFFLFFLVALSPNEKEGSEEEDEKEAGR